MGVSSSKSKNRVLLNNNQHNRNNKYKKQQQQRAQQYQYGKHNFANGVNMHFKEQFWLPGDAADNDNACAYTTTSAATATALATSRANHYYLNENDPAAAAGVAAAYVVEPSAFDHQRNHHKHNYHKHNNNHHHPNHHRSHHQLSIVRAYTPSPPPPAPSQSLSAASTAVHQLDSIEDPYQSYHLNHHPNASVALGQQEQHMPIYEDADDFYLLDHLGHEQATTATVYSTASNMHLNSPHNRDDNNHHNHNHNQNNHNNNRQFQQQLQQHNNPNASQHPLLLDHHHHHHHQSNQALARHSNPVAAAASVNNIYQSSSGTSGGAGASAQQSLANNYQYQLGGQQQPLSTTTTAASRRQQQLAARRRKLIAQHKRAAQERGLAMSDEERRRNGLLGLLPPAYQDQDLQSRAVLNFLDKCQDELGKYIYLRHLKDFNENLFYYTLTNNVEKLMPLVYTPTVGLACQKFSEIYMRPRGLFVTSKDLGRVRQVIGNWPAKDVRVIVVTDGERILGLGDLGANGMGISIGKLSLYTALAGIPPQNVLPVTIDVGTNNEINLQDPFYIGLRQRRDRGEKFEALIEEFMQAVVERWGRSCLIQFEDFANTTAFVLLERYRNTYCTFNDDIQGTASVSVSGLLTATRMANKRLGDCTFLFYGAGEANLGTVNLILMAMQDEGLTRDEAKRRVWLVDSKGLVVKSRNDLNEHKAEYAQDADQLRDLEQIVDFVKPTAIVGASAQGGSFTQSICNKMAQYNERPIIFALSNPTSKAECTAEQAYKWTNSKCVFASGSPFDPINIDGRTYITGQGNNAYIFPGVGLAAIAAHTHTVPEQVFLVAARALSDQVTPGDLEVGLVYPSLTKIREVTLRVAMRVLEYFYAERLANYNPEPSNKEEFLKSLQYDPRY